MFCAKSFDDLHYQNPAEEKNLTRGNYEKKSHILIVEDRIEFRVLIRKMLDSQGTDMEIEEVEDGASAIEIIKIKQFDCILLDFLLGDSTGYQILRRIKEIQPQFPNLVVTAYGNPSLVDEVLDMGVSGFILKENLSVDNLTKVLGEILQTSQTEGQKQEAMLDDPLSYKGLEGMKLLMVDDTSVNLTVLRKM